MRMPSKEVLQQRLNEAGFPKLAQHKGILSLADARRTAGGVSITVESALFDFWEDEKELNQRRRSIFGCLLAGYPDAIKEIEAEGLLDEEKD